jgi:colanic acid biosynthesis glycosyl transferase WcaI
MSRGECEERLGKVIFVNRFFYPDQSATSQLLSDLAFHLAEQGWEVMVICSRQRYLDEKAKLQRREKVLNVQVHRVGGTNFGRYGLKGRMVDYISFYLTAALRLVYHAGRDDIVVAMTDPPLMSVLARPALWVKRARQVNWLQDLFPEVAESASISYSKSLPFRVLRRLRDRSLRAAAMNVVIGEKMSERVRAGGSKQVQVIPNWSIRDDIRPIPQAENPRRRALGLDDAFVVGYSGNLGRVHSFAAMLETAKYFDSVEKRNDPTDRRPPVRFVLFGGGYLLEQLKDAVRENRLSNVQFHPYQPLELLGQTLSLPDVHWISLHPSFEGLVLPSKFYGVLAAGRPIIHVGALDGEIPQLLQKWECGLSVHLEDSHGFIAAVEKLRSEPSIRESMGDCARRLYDEQFEPSSSRRSWAALLEQVTGAGGTTY